MATAKPLTRRPAAGYDEDYYAWTQAQAAALRRLAADGRELPLDLLNLAEEVEDLGRAERNACRSQVVRILEHFLKLAWSPAHLPRSGWKRSIMDGRNELGRHVTRTIERRLVGEVESLYQEARDAVVIDFEEHGEAVAGQAIPDRCPFTWDEIRRRNWYPEPVSPPAAPPGT
jgi:hypothetical protein